MTETVLIIDGEITELATAILKAAVVNGSVTALTRDAADRLRQSDSRVTIAALPTDEAGIRTSIDTVVARRPGIAVIILSQEQSAQSLLTIDGDAWNREVTEPLEQLFVLTQAAAAAVARGAGGAGGSVTNVLEANADRGVATVVKSVFTNLTRAMALDLGHRHIRVNGVVAKGGGADPAEIARTVVFLSSDAAAYMTGSVLE